MGKGAKKSVACSGIEGTDLYKDWRFLLFSEISTALLRGNLKNATYPNNNSSNSDGSCHSLSDYYTLGTIPDVLYLLLLQQHGFQLYDMFATEQDSEDRFVLEHTSKENYFLNFQKGDFYILPIYSTLTLQRLFIFFSFHLHKSLEQQESLPLLYIWENQSSDYDQSHTGNRQRLGHSCPDSNSHALPTTPKLPPMRMGPETTVNANPYRTYKVHSIQLTFIDYWLCAIHLSQWWRLRSEKVTDDIGKEFRDYRGRPSCK